MTEEKATRKANMKFERTNRGFGLWKFYDTYGCLGTVQDSSSAEEAKIWLGPSSDQKENPIRKLTPGRGWHNYEIPLEAGESILLPDRMHLNIAQTKQLIKVLQHFVDTGYLPTKMPKNPPKAETPVEPEPSEVSESPKPPEEKEEKDEILHSP